VRSGGRGRAGGLFRTHLVRRSDARRRATVFSAVLIALAVSVLLLAHPDPGDAASDVVTLCLSPCHSAPGLIGPDVSTAYLGAGENAGHKMGWGSSVVADASGATLPQGSRMPCDECHVPHGRTTASIYMFSETRVGSQITTTRQLCEGCHRPCDSAESTPVVCGLKLKRLSLDVPDHSEASDRPCSECHGSTGHSPESHAGGIACGDAACHGSSGSHGVHLDESDPRGPGQLDCSDDCHQTGDFPYFKAGTDDDESGHIELDETTVCDECHSPSGDYDGIQSSNGSVGAKDNWTDKVYASATALQPDKEKWCAGCHDGNPSVIAGVAAPNVVGDETATDGYGPWGYYKTGHGLPAGVFPASEAPAADIGCDGCHDNSWTHIDGDARTYSSASDNYRAGYRLVSVGGGEPMDIPRTDWSQEVVDFALCFECHESDMYINNDNKTSNFGPEGTWTGHTYHTLGAGSHKNKWNSDWTGTGWDSYMSCPSCHNVHGSPTPAMTRHGELVSTPGTTDRVPGLNIWYVTTQTVLFPTLSQSSGGSMIFPNKKAEICYGCHYSTTTYTRTPNDFYEPRIVRAYGRVGSSTIAVAFSEGVYTNTGSSGALVPADLTLVDLDDSRTIAGLSHAAGEDVANMTLSSALDASMDLWTDTVSAATTASMFDADDRAAATETVTIREDASGPVVSDALPANGTPAAAQDVDLSFRLSDAGCGVDWTTFSITLSGDKGYSRTYTDLDTTVVSQTGTRLGYHVSVAPDAMFALGEDVTVTVAAQDYLGNALVPPVWSFSVESAPTLQTMILHPSDVATNPGGYSTLPYASQWADYLDTDDGDATRVQSGTGGPGARLFMSIDDAAGLLGSEVVQSVTLHTRARYVIAGGEPVTPTSGPMRLGYKTGSTTVWEADANLDSGGQYNLVSSATYTTDSDGTQLTWADVANLEVAVERRHSGGYWLRLTEMWAEVTYLTSDVTTPTITDFLPSHETTGVSIAADLTFTLADEGSGIDWTTFQIQLAGSKGYSKTYTDADTSVVSKTGNPDSLAVTVNPDADFAVSETITVTVDVDDFAGNPLSPPEWSFTTEAVAAPQTLTLHPSGIASNPGGYWTVPTADQWPTYLDSNDGDATHATSTTGAQGAVFYVDMDDTSGLSGATIQDITFYTYARYVSGFSPDPPPYPGTLDVGYKTGASTVWKGDTAIDGSGSYNLVSSATYTTDSDGGSLEVADIDALQLSVKRRTSGGYPLRVTEMYAVVTYVPGGGEAAMAPPPLEESLASGSTKKSSSTTKPDKLTSPTKAPKGRGTESSLSSGEALSTQEGSDPVSPVVPLATGALALAALGTRFLRL